MLAAASVIAVLGLVSNSLSPVHGKKIAKPDSKVARNVLEGKAEGYCSPSGPIESTHCLYETVESLNAKLFPSVHKLVEYPFFRHYKVDLFRECPFWYENGFCTNRDCGVETADESEIPEKWRTRALSEVRVSSPEDQISSCYFREQDFCYIEDDANHDGQYVDLALNPERFTGYAGPSAHHVWQTIYEENCFGLSEGALDSPNPSEKRTMASMAAGLGGSSPAGFSRLSEGWGTEMIKSASESEMCEEKKVYYRVISGLHASISIHICNEYLDQQTGLWSPNLQCFINRLATHPERLSNVYFNAVLLLRAVARAAPYLEAYDIGVAPTGKKLDARGLALREDDRNAKDNFRQVLDLARQGGLEHGFDEGDFFTGPDAVILKEQFKTHFRNVSRIMDCVGCDKCRLWGKLQVSGFGTALKILFELDDKALDPKVNPDLLQRSEVVALFNTLHRTSESLAAVEHFRHMYADTQAVEAENASAQNKTTGMREQIGQTPFAWLSATSGVLVSAIEAMRRSCKGCLDICWSTIERGPLGEWLDLARRQFAEWTERIEL